MSIFERIVLEGRGGEEARRLAGFPSAAALRPSSSKAARRPSRCSPSRPSHSRPRKMMVLVPFRTGILRASMPNLKWLVK